MAQNYLRNFIVLTQENKEYTMTGKKALGKCIIECKSGSGKVTFSAQNLKSGSVCQAYIISHDGAKSTGVEIGRIIADDKGKGEIKFECNAYDVNNSGIALKDFNMAGILDIKESEISAPLFGYLDGEKVWKTNFTVYQKKGFTNQSNQVTAEREKENNNKALSPEKRENAVTPPSKAPVPERREDTIKTPMPERRNPPVKTPANSPQAERGENNEVKPALPKKGTSDLTKPAPFEKSDPLKDYGEGRGALDNFKELTGAEPALDEHMESPRHFNPDFDWDNGGRAEPMPDAGETNTRDERQRPEDGGPDTPEVGNQSPLAGIEKVFKSCPVIRPFKSVQENLNWIKISPNEFKYLPDGLKSLAGAGFINYCFNKFRHLILGKIIEGDRIVLIFGAPDIYMDESVNKAKETGMEFFKCCDSGLVTEGKHGYWLKTVTLFHYPERNR